MANFAIPIALHRPQIGLWPEMGKNCRKMDFGPTGKKPKNGKIGPKIDQKWVKNGHYSMFRRFFLLFLVGPKSIFRPLFPHFGPEARFGVCTGQSGSQGKLQTLSSPMVVIDSEEQMVKEQTKKIVDAPKNYTDKGQ